MKISVLMENTSLDSELTAEHGLSLYIETKHHKILFDTGQTAAFAKNAEKMGIDLRDVDIAVLSHGHYDHGGGLKKFLELNDHARIFLNEYAFMPHYNGVEKYIGLDETLCDNKRFIMTGDELIIDEELSLYSCNHKDKIVSTDSFGLNMLCEGQIVPDDFRHEQYLMIKEGEQQVLFSGCSHKGILNIVNWFQPDVLIGGFHFMKLDPNNPADRKRLETSAKELLRYPTMYETCHCTGAEQYEFLKEIMCDRLNYICAGQIFYL